jgi:hypothetical protein
LYVNRYVDELKTVEDPEIQLGREFIIEQLLLITSFMDTADVASKYVSALCVYFFSSIIHRLERAFVLVLVSHFGSVFACKLVYSKLLK